MKQPIGIIDSGVGGVSVVRALLERNPDTGFVYLGDQARCPYGERTVAELETFTMEMIHYLIDNHHVSAIVVACNTISANCLPQIRAQFTIPIISIVECGLALARERQLEPLGVIATSKTIASQMYQRELEQWNVFALATPPFAMYVETQHYTQADIATILAPLQTKKLQGLILGCTHYPFLASEIAAALPNCQLLDPAVMVEATLGTLMQPTKRQLVLTTGSAQHFEQLLHKLVPEFSFLVQHIDL